MDKNDFYNKNTVYIGPGDRTYILPATELFKRNKSMTSRIQNYNYQPLTAEEISSIEELEEKRKIEQAFPEEEREAAYELIQAIKDAFNNET